ncbi:MAG TPA: hypothetical protein VN157_14825 [Caulobacter sp.]|nr:hypothetical protein [Caulobacter sp.]
MTVVVLGDEWDRALIGRTIKVLEAMGARLVDKFGGVAGSQEVGVQVWDLEGQTVRLEAETYMGFSIEAPDSILVEVQRRLA